MAKIPVTPELDSNTQQVGDVVHSMLDEAQFQVLRSDNWVLMDGRSVVGSEYETLTGNSTIPDARGQFLRSKNNGRVDGQENPAGDSALGTQQTDAMQLHAHDHNAGTGSEFGSYPDGAATGPVVNIGILGPSEYLGGGVPRTDVETRPKNVTVNIFIKIN